MAAGAVAAKVIASLAKSKDGRGLLKKIIIVLLVIVILLVGAICTIMDSLSNGAETIFSWVFGGKPVNEISMDAGSQYTEEIRQYIDDEHIKYETIDKAVSLINGTLGPTGDESYDRFLDKKWIRANYYAICCDNYNDRNCFFYIYFVECFITTEKHNDTEIYVPETDMNKVYINIEKLLKVSVTDEMKNNAKTYNDKMT